MSHTSHFFGHTRHAEKFQHNRLYQLTSHCYDSELPVTHVNVSFHVFLTHRKILTFLTHGKFLTFMES